MRSAVELAKLWRQDKALRFLQAEILVADKNTTLVVSGACECVCVSVRVCVVCVCARECVYLGTWLSMCLRVPGEVLRGLLLQQGSWC
jgi:hypothetical protein